MSRARIDLGGGPKTAAASTSKNAGADKNKVIKLAVAGVLMLAAVILIAQQFMGGGNAGGGGPAPVPAALTTNPDGTAKMTSTDELPSKPAWRNTELPAGQKAPSAGTRIAPPGSGG